MLSSQLKNIECFSPANCLHADGFGVPCPQHFFCINGLRPNFLKQHYISTKLLLLLLIYL